MVIIRGGLDKTIEEELNKQCQRTTTPQYKKTFFQLTAATILLLSLVLFTDNGVALNRQLQKVSKDGAAQTVYQDMLTGDRFGTSRGDSLSAVRLADLYSITTKKISSVIRWGIDSNYVFTAIYVMEPDSFIIATIPENPPSSLSEELVEFVINESPTQQTRILESGIEPYGTEITKVEGVSIVFNKWKLTTPEGTKVEFWRGIPQQ